MSGLRHEAKKFKEKRSLKYSEKLFTTVIKYAVFCYQHLIKDNEDKETAVPPYSMSWCREYTRFKFEDYLKTEFVDNYLQTQKKSFADPKINHLAFQYETQKTYKQEGIKASDKIDIFVSNLGLQQYWSKAKEEDIYFAIECKRLKNTAKNKAYISDIQKFVKREYKFRFPFNGMIGFVEKGSKPIDKIIDDINQKLKTHKIVATTKELTQFAVNDDFKYCRISNHRKKTSNTNSIIIYHLFFDYSEIIID